MNPWINGKLLRFEWTQADCSFTGTDKEVILQILMFLMSKVSVGNHFCDCLINIQDILILTPLPNSSIIYIRYSFVVAARHVNDFLVMFVLIFRYFKHIQSDLIVLQWSLEAVQHCLLCLILLLSGNSKMIFKNCWIEIDRSGRSAILNEIIIWFKIQIT